MQPALLAPAGATQRSEQLWRLVQQLETDLLNLKRRLVPEMGDLAETTGNSGGSGSMKFGTLAGTIAAGGSGTLTVDADFGGGSITVENPFASTSADSGKKAWAAQDDNGDYKLVTWEC